MAEVDVILVVRRTREFWLHNRMDCTINSTVQKMIEMWNASFGLKFIEYSNRIRDIASSTYMDNKFDRIFLHSHNNPIKISNKQEEIIKMSFLSNAIIVPMDQDDWISLSLAEVLRGIETNKDFFVWNYYVTWCGKKYMPFKSSRKKAWTGSCSWAIRGYNHFLERRNHLAIPEEKRSEVFFIEQPMAVKVDHGGSLGCLKQIVRRNFKKENEWIKILITKIQQDLKVGGEEIPVEFQKQWIAYKTLLKELLLSCQLPLIENEE